MTPGDRRKTPDKNRCGSVPGDLRCCGVLRKRNSYRVSVVGAAQSLPLRHMVETQVGRQADQAHVGSGDLSIHGFATGSDRHFAYSS
jgi:hypothetical protein